MCVERRCSPSSSFDDDDDDDDPNGAGSRAEKPLCRRPASSSSTRVSASEYRSWSPVRSRAMSNLRYDLSSSRASRLRKARSEWQQDIFAAWSGGRVERASVAGAVRRGGVSVVGWPGRRGGRLPWSVRRQKRPLMASSSASSRARSESSASKWVRRCGCRGGDASGDDAGLDSVAAD